jgi:hypothetical protein
MRTTQTHVQDEFLAMLCADEELLRAEFDAIVAAGWAPGPPPRPGAHRGDGQPQPGSVRAGTEHTGVSLLRRPRRPGVGGWARGRSPPGDAP